MSLLSQWLLSAACLIGGLILNKGLRRLDIPKFPWRLPWIALTSWAIETTLISLGVPRIDPKFQRPQSNHHRTGHQSSDRLVL